MHIIRGSLKGGTDDEADLVIVPISYGLEFPLCVLEGFWDIKAATIDRYFLLDLARQRLSTTLVPRRMATYLVILPGDDLPRPHIQILHLTFMSHSVVFMSLFGLVITTLTRALGQIPRHMHLTLTSSSSSPRYLSSLAAFISCALATASTSPPYWVSGTGLGECGTIREDELMSRRPEEEVCVEGCVGILGDTRPLREDSTLRKRAGKYEGDERR
jgi:hypothetical protein